MESLRRRRVDNIDHRPVSRAQRRPPPSGCNSREPAMSSPPPTAPTERPTPSSVPRRLRSAVRCWPAWSSPLTTTICSPPPPLPTSASPLPAERLSIPGSRAHAASPATGAVSLSWATVAGADVRSVSFHNPRRRGSHALSHRPDRNRATRHRRHRRHALLLHPYRRKFRRRSKHSSAEATATPTAAAVRRTLSDADIGSPGKPARHRSTVPRASGRLRRRVGHLEQLRPVQLRLHIGRRQRHPRCRSDIPLQHRSLGQGGPDVPRRLCGRRRQRGAGRHPEQRRELPMENLRRCSFGIHVRRPVPAPTTSAPVWLQLRATAMSSPPPTAPTERRTRYRLADHHAEHFAAGRLAVTAHNNGLLATATFANVAIPVSTAPPTIPGVPVLAAVAGRCSQSFLVARFRRRNVQLVSLDNPRRRRNHALSYWTDGNELSRYRRDCRQPVLLHADRRKLCRPERSVDRKIGNADDPPPAGSPSDADIGSPGKTGSGSFNSSTGAWTVSGGGSDIWNNSDQFNFASASVTGNATLTTEVTSLNAVDPWTKAGLMFRDGSGATAPNVALVVTGSNGISFQWRRYNGDSSSLIVNVPGIAAPNTCSADLAATDPFGQCLYRVLQHQWDELHRYWIGNPRPRHRPVGGTCRHGAQQRPSCHRNLCQHNHLKPRLTDGPP